MEASLVSKIKLVLERAAVKILLLLPAYNAAVDAMSIHLTACCWRH